MYFVFFFVGGFGILVFVTILVMLPRQVARMPGLALARFIKAFIKYKRNSFQQIRLRSFLFSKRHHKL